MNDAESNEKSTDCEWLSKVPREKSPEDAQAAEEKRDRERGPYVPHHHRSYAEESRH